MPEDGQVRLAIFERESWTRLAIFVACLGKLGVLAAPGMQSVEECIPTPERGNETESIFQRKLAALDELKKSLLYQAFSGQL